MFFSVLQSGSLKIITHDWKSCSCVLNFPFFNSSPPSIFDAKQPNVGNCYSLGDTEGFQMVFMFLGTAEIWLISFSRNSGIIIISFFFFLFTVMKNRFAVLGEGSRMRKVRLGREDEFILTLSLFQPPKLNSMLFY